MKGFYIYQEEMVGSYKVGTVSAETKEEALQIYIKEHSIPEDEEWMYFAVDKQAKDEEMAFLKEAGYSSWDAYYNDMYPSRPIEL